MFNILHALNPDGSTKWEYSHPLTLLHPVMSPLNDTLVIGGGEFGNAFYLALDANGAPKWQVDLPVEVLGPFSTVQAFPQGRARFTPDGSVAYVMASSGTSSGGHCYLYALQVGPSVDVGHAMFGTLGEPELATSGSLVPGTPVTVSLTNANPNANSYLVLGLQPAATPFKQGVVLPSDDFVIQLPTNAAGQIQFTVPWPQNSPSNVPLYAQYWIADPAGPEGWVASNAVSLITP